jgi:glycerol-3-phosphate dehydrogenase
VSSAEPHQFSPEGRARALEEMAKARLDILVVGGGITGAGIARDAALRGWKVGLVERADFAFGTSSRSSKIIHGGVRYLEYGQFLLVRESARERRVLRRIAPHLVHPIPFLYPAFADDTYWLIKVGLTLFDAMARASAAERHRNLDPEDVRRRLPGLRGPLKGGVLYLEYITDDARFTMENALSAALHGAWVANHASARLVTSGGRVVGAEVTDALTGRTRAVDARVVVNATGAWAERTLAEGGLEPRRPLVPSKGIHLLLDAAALPIEGACFLKASNGRRGLAMRRLDRVYVGTSDEEYKGPLEAPRATRAEVEELLAMVQDCFPDAGLTLADVRATWAGIRPLILQPGKSTRDTSRHDEVWSGTPGLVTIAGGKLTTYRPMARRTLKAVARQLGEDPPGPARTDAVPLPGGDLGGVDAESYRAARTSDLLRLGVTARAAARLAWLYGRQLEDLLALGESDGRWLEPLHAEVPALRGEARLAVEREMASTLIDFMDRRSALLLFAEHQGEAGAEAAATIMGEVLGWSAERRAREVAAYRSYAEEHRLPPPPAERPPETVQLTDEAP